jgi:hypothetical protein|tara:strand:+ start:237 stop:398 length:162 start_codon:yes stop_codon:yes gene_type:complete
MRGDLQRINLRVTQLERNNRKLRLQIAKLEKEKLELKGNLMQNSFDEKNKRWI